MGHSAASFEFKCSWWNDQLPQKEKRACITKCLSVSSCLLQWLPQRAEDEAVEDESEQCQVEGPAAPRFSRAGQERPHSSCDGRWINNWWLLIGWVLSQCVLGSSGGTARQDFTQATRCLWAQPSYFWSRCCLLLQFASTSDAKRYAVFSPSR